MRQSGTEYLRQIGWKHENLSKSLPRPLIQCFPLKKLSVGAVSFEHWYWGRGVVKIVSKYSVPDCLYFLKFLTEFLAIFFEKNFWKQALKHFKPLSGDPRIWTSATSKLLRHFESATVIVCGKTSLGIEKGLRRLRQ